MRKKTIRYGMRLVLGSLLIIITASFYHVAVSDFFSFSYEAEMRFYQYGIFIAAFMGAYGVVVSAFGLVLPTRNQDFGVRITPTLIFIICAVSLFFYLLISSFDTSTDPANDRLRPGETITI